jgi:hypothetical protein
MIQQTLDFDTKEARRINDGLDCIIIVSGGKS